MLPPETAPPTESFAVKTRLTLPSVLALSAVVSTLTTSAFAHILLDAPMRRHDNANDTKVGPCGPRNGSMRSTDPERITTYEPGAIITVQWHEEIHHPGHYRIAFDDDGQDSFVDKTGPTDIVDPPVLPVLLDGIPDPTGGNDVFSVEVTLPDIECDNCTLQVIQYMTDDNEPYYQCADLVLKRTSTGSGGNGGTGTGGDGIAGEGGGDAGTGGAGPDGGGGSLPGSGGGPFGTGGSLAGGGRDTGAGAAGGTESGGAATGGAALATGGAALATGGAATGGSMEPAAGGMTMDDYLGDHGVGDENGCSFAPSRAVSGAFGWWMLAGLALVRRGRRRTPRT